MKKSLFDVETPFGHEDRVLSAVAGELAARREKTRASRRHWILGLLGGAGGLVAASYAGLLYFRGPGAGAAAEDDLFLAKEIEETDADLELLADVPLDEAEDFDRFLEDLELLEEEDV